MLIGELSIRTGFTRDTIRFYEKKGLIRDGKDERRDNGYKEYSEETAQRLKSIKLMKSFGFTLNEISELLDLIDINQATCGKVSDKAEKKIQLLDEKIKELTEIKTSLRDGLKCCSGDSCHSSSPEENCPAIIAGEM